MVMDLTHFLLFLVQCQDLLGLGHQRHFPLGFNLFCCGCHLQERLDPYQWHYCRSMGHECHFVYCSLGNRFGEGRPDHRVSLCFFFLPRSVLALSILCKLLSLTSAFFFHPLFKSLDKVRVYFCPRINDLLDRLLPYLCRCWCQDFSYPRLLRHRWTPLWPASVLAYNYFVAYGL